MQILTRRPALRWIAPVALALAVGGTGVVAVNADADPKLAPRTAEQLLVDLQGSDVAGLSGTVVQEAQLGLPALPSMGGGADASQLTSLLTGSHTLRVWYDGPDKARFALLDDDLGETDVIVNGSDLWTWSYQDRKATHATLPEDSGPGERRTAAPGVPTTPQEAARTALDAIGDSTVVSTDSAVEVANRPARELVLAPTDQRSLITQVRIAVDDETSAPLRVQVLGQDAQTVAEIGFTAVDFSAPDDGQFAFNPPSGTEVTEKGALEAPERKAPSAADREAAEAAKAATEVVGEGWTTVVVTELPADAAAADGQLGAVLATLPTVSGTWGSGKLLAGTAFSAVLTDDGRVAVGAVQPQLLYDALAK
ncbi:Outer membrane lipoprotein-sorting protein [Friedmanniella luteola]|uniref:Outer membrane lipoprotein-sorting protein n=1 Tax=Friedmanniella luteola TaxID=546871 RepID=A0A1H1YXR1_9ACTN|nr:sigma-E factor regulatory protein RseB domain-containing protein [Friedmanniella luteola]SDT25726.1 Outer membrane lipoprotein-sorting protein [Friedmanniella luteola]